MRALLFERSLPKYAAAKVAGGLVPGLGARVGPLTLADVDEPHLPGPGWRRVRPRLAGICGSDLATVDGQSSRYFEPIVSFPFVPGHEVVGDLDGGGGRVVIEPVLGCTVRGVDPPCQACADGHLDRCERIAFGDLEPGAQTGYCADTGGGWSTGLVAHESQLHPVPVDMSDEAAVMVEPTACAIHGVLAAGDLSAATVLVLGAGTLGLCAIAALRRFTTPGLVIAVAKHPEQRRLAAELGAEMVVDAAESRRAVRRATGSLQMGSRLSGGADVVFDCVGSEASVAEDLAVARPGGLVVLLGMPSTVTLDLTPLWQRQISLRGSYAYGVEPAVTGLRGPNAVAGLRGPNAVAGLRGPNAVAGLGGRRTFDLAFELVAEAGLGRLVSALYTLDRYREAIDHAANAGRRGAVKVAFDLRGEKRR